MKPLVFSPRTVPASAARGLIEALEAIEGDTAGALARSGLSHLGDESVIEIPRRSFARLAQECVMAFHYHGCRRDGRPRFPVSSFRLMCLAMLACPTLRVAAGIAMEFQRVALEGRARIELIIDSGTARLVMDTYNDGRGMGDLLLTMYGLAAFHRLLGWLTRHEIKLDRVALSYAPATEQATFNELLQLEPDFGQKEDSITFSEAYLDRPIVRSYAELDELFALFPFDLLPPDYDTGGLAEQIRSAIASSLARGETAPDLRRIATMFGLSVPTLRRRVAAEGTSLRTLQRECSRHLAADLLSETSLSVKEIASRLGFSDVATFRRAFKAWEGKAPAAYRTARRDSIIGSTYGD